jgi:hypothetical protein
MILSSGLMQYALIRPTTKRNHIRYNCAGNLWCIRINIRGTFDRFLQNLICRTRKSSSENATQCLETPGIAILSSIEAFQAPGDDRESLHNLATSPQVLRERWPSTALRSNFEERIYGHFRSKNWQNYARRGQCPKRRQGWVRWEKTAKYYVQNGRIVPQLPLPMVSGSKYAIHTLYIISSTVRPEMSYDYCLSTR